MHYDMYIVKAGDTLYDIAKRSGASVEELMQINNLTGHRNFMVGTSLYVPWRNGSYFDKYLVEQGDDLSRVAGKFKTTPEILSVVNGINSHEQIHPNQIIMIPKKDVKIYLTEEGETLSNIARNAGINEAEILKHNKNLAVLPNQMLFLK